MSNICWNDSSLSVGVCFLCGKTAVLVKTFSNVTSVNNIPYFPFLLGITGAEGSHPRAEDGSVSCCQLCYHSLHIQWSSFEKLNLAMEQRNYKVQTKFEPKILMENQPTPFIVSETIQDPEKVFPEASFSVEPPRTFKKITISMPGKSGLKNRQLFQYKPYTSAKKGLKRPLMNRGPSFGNQAKNKHFARNTPVSSIGALCYTCAKVLPVRQTYAVSMEKVDETTPYFPLLKPFRYRDPSSFRIDDNKKKSVCVICYHTLVDQWLQNSAKTNPISPEQLEYNLMDYVCYVCGVTTYRRRVVAISCRKFPFVRTLVPRPGVISMFGGEWVVACLTCNQNLMSQWSEYERMKVPLQLRNYNWIVVPAPKKSLVYPELTSAIVEENVCVRIPEAIDRRKRRRIDPPRAVLSVVPSTENDLNKLGPELRVWKQLQAWGEFNLHEDEPINLKSIPEQVSLRAASINESLTAGEQEYPKDLSIRKTVITELMQG